MRRRKQQQTEFKKNLDEVFERTTEDPYVQLVLDHLSGDTSRDSVVYPNVDWHKAMLDHVMETYEADEFMADLTLRTLEERVTSVEA